MIKSIILGFFFGAVMIFTTAAIASDERAVTYRKFEVVEAEGKVVGTVPIADAADSMPLWAKDVAQEKHNWQGSYRSEPYFEKPQVYVKPPVEGSGEPFYSHNHQPDITWLENGDLMAIWYTTDAERGTELTVVASRLRAGSSEWEPCSEFFKAENRNMHGNAIYYDANTGFLHHINGMGKEGATGWENLALLHRFSTDNGKTFSAARAISTGANYQRRHQVIAGIVQTKEGFLIVPCDATPSARGATAIHISRDGGMSWSDPGGDIRGIHAGLEQLKDGRLLAFGRVQPIDGKMPISISNDLGKTWEYSASEFPPIGGGQRLVFRRLNEGALMLVSFTEPDQKSGRNPSKGMEFEAADGTKFTGYGMYAAISYDEGESWPVRKLITPCEGSYDGGAWTKDFTATPTKAEHAGYLAATQTPDGVIHLISSKLHYRFNLKWLEQKTECVKAADND